MSWSEEAWHKIGPILEEIHNHPFVKGLADGTLPKESFARYLTQDKIYLANYGHEMRDLAAMLPEGTLQDLYRKFAQESIDTENALHEQLAEMGFESIDNEPLAGTLGYMRHTSGIIAERDLAVSMAAMMLLADEADAVLAVGSESVLCPLVIYSLANAHTLSRMNDDPLHACRPFDAARNGFVIGEGGGALVLERESHAKARGAEIYAELAGWANNNDAYHVMQPDPDGKMAARCMQMAMDCAGVAAQQIDHINAHGTGTKQGDSAELAAISQVFGDARPAITSTKGATGHLMGGGGLTESIACIQAIRTGIIPPTLNLDDPEGDFDYVAGQMRRQHVETAMTNAFGFGGQNASLIFRKYEG